MALLKTIDLKNNKNRIQKIFHFYRYDKWLIIWVSILALVGLALILPVPYIYSRYIDEMLRYKDMILFRNLILIYLLLTFIKAGIHYLHQHLLIIFNQKLLYRIRRAMVKAILNTPYHYFKKNQSGYILSRIYQDVNNLEPIFPGSFLNLANRIISLLISAVLIFLINWKLALFAFAISPLFFSTTCFLVDELLTTAEKFRKFGPSFTAKPKRLLQGPTRLNVSIGKTEKYAIIVKNKNLL